MKRSFKLLLLSICVIIIGTSFVGCNKNYSEEISFFNYGENIDEETIKEFEKQYGIKVNVETFDDMETMYQKVSNSGVKYDVILVSDALMPRMIKNNLVQELNKDNIPNISQMDEDYLNLDIDPGNKYSVPYMFGTVGLIYNKDVVKEDVDSWDILWDEKYKNRIFMFDTYRDTLGAALKKLGYSLNSENQKEIEEAKEEDFYAEYLDYIISIKTVNSIGEAIEHINECSTKHSESIITENYENAQKFLNEIDSSCVYVNASTRFTDGGQFGFGAEIGISTQKLHARGPMGLKELTTTKYIIYGNGQIRG